MKPLFKKILVCFILFSTSTVLFGQEEDVVQSIIGRFVEIWAENEVSEEEISRMSEEMYALSENPISLNDNELSPLSDIHLLSEYQIAVIKNYRRRHGTIHTIWELALLPEFPAEDIRLLSPFVTVFVEEKKRGLKQILRYTKNEIISEYKRTVEVADGYRPKEDKPAAYPGSPDKVYVRYMLKARRDFSAGITAKKDPGEPFFKEPRTEGFDYYSAHAYIHLDRFVKEISVGDYTVNFANGLTVGYGMMSGKSSQAVAIKQNTSRIRRYSGATEFGFMRGAATTLQYKSFRTILFASHKNIDANVKTDTVNGITYISSMPQTGYHRTQNELSQRKAAEENIIGANIQYRSESFRFGVNSVAVKYNHTIQRDFTLYRIFEPNTDMFANVSADYQYINRGILLWGELATDKNQNYAFLQGINFKTTDIAQLALHYRKYSPEYYSPLALSFGDSDNGSNEEGLYAGLLLYPFSRVEINAYADMFRFPWLKYRRSSPSQGFDYMVDMRWSPRRNIRFASRFRMKETSYDVISDTIIPRQIDAVITTRIHLQSDIDFTKFLSSQTRVAATFFDNYKGKQNGWMMYQELTWRFLKAPLRLSARYAIFNTDSYDTRIYAYEKDVLYAFSIPALYSTGSRYYLVATWKPARNISVYAKWSQTIWSNVYELSSGNDRIEGNTRSQFTLKMKVNF
jgi:hypothetical protein